MLVKATRHYKIELTEDEESLLAAGLFLLQCDEPKRPNKEITEFCRKLYQELVEQQR